MISRAHAALRRSDLLIETRREIYRFAAGSLPLTDTTIDNPLIRNVLRDVIVDARELCEADIDQVESIADRAVHVTLGQYDLKVVAAPDSDRELSHVLDALGNQRTSFRTEAHPEFKANLQALQDGADLAARTTPGLVDDLVPHVGFVGILRPLDGHLAVHSASPRHFPGMILLGDPRTPVESAEMLLHEAAHARYYDSLIVHDLLPSDADEFERFSPSWRAPGTQWPLEQVVAAFHAYAVLAEFAFAVGVHDRPDRVGSASLLPCAQERMREIGRWVYDRLDRLGSEAPGFVCGLLDLDVPPVPPPAALPGMPATVSVASDVQIRFGEGVGTAVVGRPGALYLLPFRTGLVLHELQEDPSVDNAVARFADRHVLTTSEAASAVRRILADLADQALIAVGGR